MVALVFQKLYTFLALCNIFPPPHMNPIYFTSSPQLVLESW